MVGATEKTENQKIRVGIHQPNFNPYLGVLAKYLLSDVVVHLDTVQFVKNEYQNRNKILLKGRPFWLTIPVIHDHGQSIRKTRIDSRVPWREKHLKTLQQGYSKTPCFSQVFDWLQSVYQFQTDSLVDWNLHFLNRLFELLEIETPVRLASEFKDLSSDPDERLIDLCHRVGASVYLAGSGGRAYMKQEKWLKAGLDVSFIDYAHPTYPQNSSEFIPFCGIVDFLFQCGPDLAGETALSGVKLNRWQASF